MTARTFPPPAFGSIVLVGDGLQGDATIYVAVDPTGSVCASVPSSAWDEGRDPYAEALAALGLRRPCQASPVLAILRAGGSWDDGDPWGSGMSWLGAVCDLSAIVGAAVPDSCGYVPAGLPSPDELDAQAADWTGEHADASAELVDLWRAWRADEITGVDLWTAAIILDRYLDAADAAGRSY